MQSNREQQVCGIYEIKHVASGKRYVGSSVDLERRLRQHMTQLDDGCHPNRLLQAAWTQYGGRSAFMIRVIETCTPEQRLEIEQRLIDTDAEFNISRRADCPRPAGLPLTEEQRLKISVATRGIKRSEKAKARIRAGCALRGQSWRDAISKARQGSKVSPEGRARLSIALKRSAALLTKAERRNMAAHMYFGRDVYNAQRPGLPILLIRAGNKNARNKLQKELESRGFICTATERRGPKD